LLVLGPESFADSPEFARLVTGDELADLTRIALEIAADARPGLDVDAYLERIDTLASRARDRIASNASALEIIRQINWVLYVEEGYRGNVSEYYDPLNSYLDQVMDRKLGIPISLSVLYRAVAAGAGLMLSGVGLPGHFVLRIDGPGFERFVDAYHGGALLNREGCRRRAQQAIGPIPWLPSEAYAAVSTSAIVARMLGNLSAIYAQAEDWPELFLVSRRLVALRPEVPGPRRNLGVACVHLGHVQEGITHLEAFLRSGPDPADSIAAVELLRRARAEVAGWN
jgi:regulator of sirC expression with transglutaminase-like and TPR domain